MKWPSATHPSKSTTELDLLGVQSNSGMMIVCGGWRRWRHHAAGEVPGMFVHFSVSHAPIRAHRVQLPIQRKQEFNQNFSVTLASLVGQLLEPDFKNRLGSGRNGSPEHAPQI